MNPNNLLHRFCNAYQHFALLAPRRRPWRAYGNWLRANWEMYRRTGRVRAKPLKLTIDPINICQLRCPLCPTGLGAQDRRQASLDVEWFRRLMDDVGDYLFFLDMFNWGEPLLHKRLEDLLAIASGKGILTTVSSNLSLPLSDDRIRRLVGCGLNELIVSVDGASQETYQNYRRKGTFALATGNMRRLVQAKREARSRTPCVTWRFLVFRFNEHEIEKARQMAGEIGVDRFVVFPASLDEGFYPIHEEDRAEMRNWLPENPEYRLYAPGRDGDLVRHEEPRLNRCDWHYVSAAVNADGNVAPCCALWETSDDFGSLGEGGARYMDVVNNSAFTSIRDRFAGRRAESTKLVCERCPAPDLMPYARELNRHIVLTTMVHATQSIARGLGRVLHAGVRRPRGAKAPSS